ncbi:phage tail protein [Streptococcus pasteurianus]|uniref:phage tail protein n=1 Tax=Streptococcus pasteurianus TaxID=197614 RepID=UPI0022841319|nr:phage tail protein [Streptococcus pasteurianus]MCY7251520.1 phage tail protein [Streptococcus pasteurianus]
MITFLNEKDVEHGALASIKITNAVNGERSLSGEIESGDYVLSNIERGWRLRFDDEFYVVTYAKPVDEGTSTHVTFDAVHQFFWDFDKSSVHEQLNDGSHTFVTYLDFIFKDSGYTYTIDPLLKVYAFEKQSFGYKSRLKLFNDIITSSGVEFQVNGKVVRILEKTGTDLSTVVRKNFNMNELGIEKNISDFVTYQKGFGAWVDENDHNKGRLTVEYTSPLASVYGKLEAEPLVDERYTKADSMTAALKENVDNSYSISITLDMEDLTRAGYDYTQPTAGDYIMAINETLGFKEKIRIVSFTSEYDITGQLVKHEVTCNDIGAVKKLSASYTLAKEQAQNASDSIAQAVETANKALVSADGKSTVYFCNEFPKDEPKGTLHKGDSLYLTVGDTTKMYYWTGADWEELPIVNDVEAFKEQIADELKDVPDREEFEATITEKLATSKAELETQIDTAKTQAETNAKAYADEINQATAEVAEQANTAVNSLKSDLAKVKTDLTATTSTANDAKTSASEAKQQLTTVANDLSKAKQDLTSQAQQLQAQASAQSELTKRVSTVEETANGTKTTVSELSKTVDSNTKNITSVTARTKVVEDDLTSTKTTLSQVKTTADNTSKKTATLETGLNGVKADLTATTTTANTTKTNLANYQASNDKAVANLRSNLQTANGNISSLQTKVEAVPGQITSAVSAVEGKIPTTMGGRNYIQNYGLTVSGWSLNMSKWLFEIVADNTARSGQYLKATCTKAGTYGFFNRFVDLRGSEWQGKKMTYSIDIKASKSVQMTVGVEAFNGGAKKFNVTTAWQRFVSTDMVKFKNVYAFPFYIPDGGTWAVGDVVYLRDVQLEDGTIATAPKPAVEDTQSDITKLNTTLTQTANGLKQLSTQVTSQGSTITSHTNSINSLTTGLSAKVSQTDFNTLSGRVTTAENNIIAKANELSSKITSVEEKIPTSVGGRNLLTKTNQGATGWDWIMQVGDRTVESLNSDGVNAVKLSKGRTTTQSGYSSILFKNVLTTLITTNTQYTLSFDVYPNVYTTFNATIMDSDSSDRLTTVATMNAAAANKWTKVSCILTRLQNSPANIGGQVVYLTGMSSANSASYIIKNIKLEKGNITTDWTPAPEDYDSKLITAQSEIKQTTDSIKASVSALDKSTVKSASLTINADGIVMKAGKSTTDVANAIGSYFAVNQNAINLFSDKINVKGSMIVDGAITSTKIASKSINTAHLNGKIITADVISAGAITANAIKAGAVTTSAMSANSINGDRITAGTLDAAKIKAGSITASQIASGTITSSQIKTGGISAANIAAGAITTDKIAANSINSSKIVSSGITANVIKGGKLQSLSNATNFELDTGKLFYNNNNTGIFRVQANASTMGLKFSNTSITVSGTSRILSRVILGGDRRETTLDDGKWDQGGFSGIVVETINGIAANDHERADSLRVIADNIYFGHSYNKDVVTNTSAAGWKMETFSPNSTYTGHVVMKPFGINSRYADIVTGDVRLDNGDGSGYWVRGCIQVLRNCFQHFLNGGTSNDAKNAIRNALKDISGV